MFFNSIQARNIHQKSTSSSTRAEVIQRLYPGSDSGRKRGSEDATQVDVGYKINNEEKALLDALHPAAPKTSVYTHTSSSDLPATFSAVDADISDSGRDDDDEAAYYDEPFEAIEVLDEQMGTQVNDDHSEEDESLTLYNQYRASSLENQRKNIVADSKGELPGTSVSILSDSKGGSSLATTKIENKHVGYKEGATASDQKDDSWNPVWSLNRGKMLPSSSEMILPSNDDQFEVEFGGASTMIEVQPSNGSSVSSGESHISTSRLSSGDSMYVTLAEPSLIIGGDVAKQREVITKVLNEARERSIGTLGIDLYRFN